VRGLRGVLSGDGDGWVRCALGHRHWGRHGAAGLLVRWTDEGGVRRILLAQRVAWSHEGGTWALPGGARDSHETAEQAALREATEEVGLDPTTLTLTHELVDDHGGWSYTTVVGDAAELPVVEPAAETDAIAWVPLPEVPSWPLHSGFATTWPQLAALD
jgi:8-oxo-dGTP diphosphatase